MRPGRSILRRPVASGPDKTVIDNDVIPRSGGRTLSLAIGFAHNCPPRASHEQVSFSMAFEPVFRVALRGSELLTSPRFSKGKLCPIPRVSATNYTLCQALHSPRRSAGHLA